MFGGFWGTPREAAWRRRQEREWRREEKIRSEEQGARIRLQAAHEREIEERKQVLDIATGLLNDARYDAGAARRRRDRAVAAADAQRETERGQSDQRGQDVENKRRRTDQPVPVKSENDAGNDQGAERGSNGVSSEEQEVEAEESVRENLLALSYAMFDTLYATRSFDARAFASFLKRQGERSLAEQIALAAVEKSGGDRDSISFVLQEMVPDSAEPDILVKAVEDLLKASKRSDGTDVLIAWKAERGDTEGAFSAALLLDNECERLNKALPLATTEHRRNQLKESCQLLLRTEVIGMFDDNEWFAFITSLLPIRTEDRWWQPTYEQYVEYAANYMIPSRGTKVAEQFVRGIISKSITKVFSSSRDGSNPYERGTRRVEECITKLVATGEKMCTEMQKSLSELSAKIHPSPSVKVNIQKLGIDQEFLIAEEIERNLQLPPENKCQTRHGTLELIFKCTKCRGATIDLAICLGGIRALRQHPNTSRSAPFLRIGLTCSPSDTVGVLTPGRSESMAQVTEALLGKDMNIRGQYFAS